MELTEEQKTKIRDFCKGKGKITFLEEHAGRHSSDSYKTNNIETAIESFADVCSMSLDECEGEDDLNALIGGKWHQIATRTAKGKVIVNPFEDEANKGWYDSSLADADPI
jgi:hypothetical protein